jgi:hypothetical protein
MNSSAYSGRYPKQQRLLALKQASVNGQAHPPTHLPLSSLQSLHPMKFDVILIDPPYADTTRDPPYGGIAWDQITELPIPALSGDPSFIFMWVGHGNSDGLERGREVLAKWGFRRCEDIVWVKTNKSSNRGPGVCKPVAAGRCPNEFILDGPSSDWGHHDSHNRALLNGNKRNS